MTNHASWRCCRLGPFGNAVHDREGNGGENTRAEAAILVVDVKRATQDRANAVVGAVVAGCNPVRLVTSPNGE